MAVLKSLDEFQETRETLHLFSEALSVIPRTHAVPHPKWWHISLRVTPRGLQTGNVPLPEGGSLAGVIDLREHTIQLEASTGESRSLQMYIGMSAAEMGQALLTAAAEFGLTGEVDRSRIESLEKRRYDPIQAEVFFHNLLEVERIFQTHRGDLPDFTGPIQFWTHGFDLSLEWYSSQLVEYQENGKIRMLPAQINLGFYPGGQRAEPYFYSNPWPFEAESLLEKDLPPGARWHTDGWQGSMLPFRELVDQPDAEDRLLGYARAVFEIARPTLSES